MNLKLGRYEAKFRAIPNSTKRKINVVSIAAYEDRDREIVSHLKAEKKRFLKKREAKGRLESLVPIQNELEVLLRIIQKSRDQKSFMNFVTKYSLQDEDMFRYLPTRQELKLYEDELKVYRMIVSKVAVSKECIDLIFLEKLKKIKFLNFSDSKGFCCINYHRINNVVRLSCGHQYQQHCWRKRLEYKEKQAGVECPVCGIKAVEVEVPEKQKESYRKEFRDFFKLETAE